MYDMCTPVHMCLGVLTYVCTSVGQKTTSRILPHYSLPESLTEPRDGHFWLHWLASLPQEPH